MKPEIILTSVDHGIKVHINTNTVCAYWQDSYNDVCGNGYERKRFTRMLFTNGKMYCYVESPEVIHNLIYAS